MRTLLLLKAGSTLPGVKSRHGDFDDWFRAHLPDALRVQTLDLPAGAELPAADACDGVLITGSAAMVTHREPWSEACAHWLTQVVAIGVPVLGVCYGHQLLAHACGGAVGPQPSGREIGTHEIRLAADYQTDPLLGELPPRFPAHLTHQESITRLPPEAIWLGASELDPNQLFRLGPCAWGMQFHPEFSVDIMRGYLQERTQVLRAEGREVETLLRAVQATPAATRLIGRFGEGLLRDRFG